MSLMNMPHTDDWTPIGQTSSQLVLYHAPSHALQVQPRAPAPTSSRSPYLLSYQPDSPSTTSIRREPVEPDAQRCPYCLQPLRDAAVPALDPFATFSATDAVPTPYFHILERAHESSRPSSPKGKAKASQLRYQHGFSADSMHAVEDDDLGTSKGAEGYYDRFFREECRLGIGAEGSVYLAQHVIGGNVLGSYAVKKVAVGTSKAYLLKMLHEVRLLETLRHPHIIPYHHAWIDVTRFSSFGPPILALHILMMYATAGNLDSFIQTRCSSSSPTAALNLDGDSFAALSKAERIKAYKRRRASMAGEKGSVPVDSGEQRAVMLLGKEEIGKLFGDVVDGLAFLHANAILHLDLKCSNVLLHWEEGQLIPKAMISDFGTSEEMLRGKRERTGHTGTMEYMAPETVSPDPTGHYRPSDSHADIWSLGMILHKLLFFRLPYADTESFDELLVQITQYRGFIPTKVQVASCERRHIPANFLVLLSKILNVKPEARPSAEKIKLGLQSLMMEDVPVPSSSMRGGIITKIAKPVVAKKPLMSPPVPLLELPVEILPEDLPVRPIVARVFSARRKVSTEHQAVLILFIKVVSLLAIRVGRLASIILALVAFTEYLAPGDWRTMTAFACFHCGLLVSLL